MTIHVLTINYRNAPVALREQLAVDPDDTGALSLQLADTPEVEGGLWISTCNRVELWVIGTADEKVLRSSLLELLSKKSGIPASEIDAHAEMFSERDAVRHMFTVASAMDSIALGETEILGQIKQSFRQASEAGALCHELSRSVERAFSTAKRIRTETETGHARVSVSSLAVNLAVRIFDDLSRRRILVLGTGHMAHVALEYFVDQRVTNITVISHHAERAATFAGPFGAKPRTYDDLQECLSDADIVLAGTAVKNDFAVSAEAIQTAIKRRSGQPLFIIDIAVPRAVDPAAADISDVILYDIDDLMNMVTRNKKARAKAVANALPIIEEETDAFLRTLKVLRAGDALAPLRETMSELCEAELTRLAPVLERMPADDAEKIRRTMQRLVNKILHGPQHAITEAIRNGREGELLPALLELLNSPSGAPAENNPTPKDQ